MVETLHKYVNKFPLIMSAPVASIRKLIRPDQAVGLSLIY